MWTNNEQATAEGWCISDCEGSDNGPFQLQRVDEFELFLSDDEAWQHVYSKAMSGSEYHQSALDYLRTANPMEYKAINKYCGAVTN